MEFPILSMARIAELSKLRMKKFRQESGLVVVDGLRVLRQIASDGIKPRELILVEGAEPLTGWEGIPASRTDARGMQRVCDTEHPQAIAALFDIPIARDIPFEVAFYLDGLSDPGNMGTIFRIASAFGIDCILLSPDCVEISSPKVIRASLGAVFCVPFRELSGDALRQEDHDLVNTSASAVDSLQELRLDRGRKTVVIIGSEAHGVRPEVEALAKRAIRIGMKPGMESLNAAIAAGIIAHQIYHLRQGTDSV